VREGGNFPSSAPIFFSPHTSLPTKRISASTGAASFPATPSISRRTALLAGYLWNENFFAPEVKFYKNLLEVKKESPYFAHVLPK
jgi:hypothetical protein